MRLDVHKMVRLVRMMFILRSFFAMAAIVIMGQTASAGCIVDDRAADLAAKIASVSKVCPGWRAIRDTDVMPLMIVTGAVAEAEARDDSCQTLVTVRTAQDFGALAAMQPDEQSKACHQITALIASNASVMSLVRELGLVRE